MASGQPDQARYLGHPPIRDSQRGQLGLGQLRAQLLVGLTAGRGIVDGIVEPRREPHGRQVVGMVAELLNAVEDPRQMLKTVVAAVGLGSPRDQVVAHTSAGRCCCTRLLYDCQLGNLCDSGFYSG